MPETTQHIEVFAPAGILYATLWDAARYPEFLTDVIDASLVASSRPTMQHARLLQRLIRETHIDLAMQGDPPALVTWHLRGDHDWLERYDANWLIEPSTDGRSVRLDLRLDVRFRTAVPDAVVRRLLDFSVPTMLRQVRARAELVARRAEAMIRAGT